jgi:hypothetical protein
MRNILEKYLYDTEDVFGDRYSTENKELKSDLWKLINGLPSLEKEEWQEVFILMNSNSLSGKVNTKEAYVVAASKIIKGYALEHKFIFARARKELYFYNSKKWLEIDMQLLKEFLKAVANKIGIPEYIASSVIFVSKLQKQLMQDAYFETVTASNILHVNIHNGTVAIGKHGIDFEDHNPQLFLTHLIDLEYNPNATYDAFKSFDSIIPSKDLQKTLQQSIAQIFVKGSSSDKKICLYGLEYDLVLSFIKSLNRVIPKDLVVAHFRRDDAALEDLFIDYKEIKKEPKFLDTLTIIPCSVDAAKGLTDLDNQLILFHWLICGAKEIIKKQQIYIAKECEEFKERFNFVRMFVNETALVKTDKNSKSIVSSYENVLKQYESFCELKDEEALSKTMLNRELKALGYESIRRESGNVWFAKFT